MVMALLLVAGVGSVSADVTYVGEARDPERDTLLYEEHHLLREVEGRRRERLVLYRCPEGAIFARKRVEYGGTASAPEFAMEDGRFGYREGARRKGNVLGAYVKMDASSAERSADVATTSRLVIDAGFDEFVRANWDVLQRGDALPIDFLVPSRLDVLGFKLRRIGAARIGDAPASVFRLSLGGLLRFFAPDIDVSYRDRDRRLMRFEGLTNIRVDRKDNLVARIDFPPTRERVGVDEAEWNAAASAALTDCQPGN